MKAATALINSQALRHNLQVVREQAPTAKVVAVVKANAYGHGLLAVAKTLKEADAYAVARIEEALMLRSCAVVKPIVLLEGFFSSADLPVLAPPEMDFAAFIRHMRRDKKVLEGKLRLVLPIGIGQAQVVADVTDEQLMAVIESGRDH